MRFSSGRYPDAQRGASIITTLIILAMVGVLLLAGLKIAPAYVDNNVIVNAMEGVMANNDISGMSAGQIRSEMFKTLNVNNVELPGDAIMVVREGGNDYVDINWERRVSLFYNIDAVVSFENRFDK